MHVWPHVKAHFFLTLFLLHLPLLDLRVHLAALKESTQGITVVPGVSGGGIGGGGPFGGDGGGEGGFGGDGVGDGGDGDPGTDGGSGIDGGSIATFWQMWKSLAGQ